MFYNFNDISKFIDGQQDRFISLLKEAVAIKSISGIPELRPEVIKMMQWYAKKLELEGAVVELIDIGKETLPNGNKIPLPPVLLASLGNDLKKKTLCIYGHLDVQPALIEDGWNTEPFVLTEKNGQLFGRGASDDKGPVVGWLNALHCYNQLKIEIPINLKFVLEGMEESGSIGLDELLISKKDTFLANVDYVCISDNYWLNTKKPCLTYGLRGICYFFIEIEGLSKDLHSGIYGGTIYEPMFDLIALMNSLVDEKGSILVPGIMDDVQKLTTEEELLYHNIDFDLNQYKKDIGVSELLTNDKTSTLMNRWRYPSLSLHGIEGAYHDPGAKTVIPKQVCGKFSIRLVPNMTEAKVSKLVVEYLNEVFKKRNSPNKLKVIPHHGGRPWLTNFNNVNFQAGRKAIEKVWGIEPDLIREGGSIPVTLTLEDVTGKNVLLLAMGAADDNAHSQNEKINISNYIQGIKTFVDYIYQLSKL